jgi:hypothetical protein
MQAEQMEFGVLDFLNSSGRGASCLETPSSAAFLAGKPHSWLFPQALEQHMRRLS